MQEATRIGLETEHEKDTVNGQETISAYQGMFAIVHHLKFE
jgi:hypothetical protein